MRDISRKAFLQSVLASASVLAAPGLVTKTQAALRQNLLKPERVTGTFDPPSGPAPVTLTGDCAGTVAYWENKDDGRPLVLYFHGTAGDYHSSLPSEYPLTDVHHVIMVNRPGYGGTGLKWVIDGVTYDLPQGDPGKIVPAGAPQTARIAAALLDHLKGKGKWRVAVIGTSGGGPAALAFASLYPDQTQALVLQAAITYPWWYEEYLPKQFLGDYRTAVDEIDKANKGLKQANLAAFQKLVTQRYLKLFLDNYGSYLVTNHNFILPLVGEKRLPDVNEDIAHEALLNIEATGTPDHSFDLAVANDYFGTFRATDPYCDWSRIKAPTLIIHDTLDPFVPVFHARQANDRLKNVTWKHDYRLGGHMIWLGSDAGRANDQRMRFLRDHA